MQKMTSSTSAELELMLKELLEVSFPADRQGEKDHLAAAFATTLIAGTAKPNTYHHALGAIPILALVMERDRGPLPKTYRSIFFSIIAGWLRSSEANVVWACAEAIALMNPRHPQDTRAFEELLRERVNGRHVSNVAYQAFFDVAPRTNAERSPAVAIIGQEFVTDHPNCFLGKFKVGGN